MRPTSGQNNYEAGLLAGRYLGRWAKSHWNGRVDEVVLLELARAGALVRARVSGILAGLKDTVPDAVEAGRVTALDGDGQYKVSFDHMRRHLRESKARYVLVGAANDASALGVARAFQEAGRATTCAIVGQNAEPDARAELREAQSPLVGSAGVLSRAIRRWADSPCARHPCQQAAPSSGVRATPDGDPR